MFWMIAEYLGWCGLVRALRSDTLIRAFILEIRGRLLFLDDGGQKHDSSGQQGDAVGVVGCCGCYRGWALRRDIWILDPHGEY